MIKTIICVVIYLVVGFDILKEAFENIKEGEIFDENFLMCVASIGALCVGEYSEAIAVMVLYRIGEYLEDKAVDKSRDSITKLMDIRPDYANIEKDGDYIKVKPEEVSVDDIIMVKPGERVPLDGVVIEGNSRLDTAALTGESLPMDVEVGTQVCSGTVNLDGMLKLKVTHTSEQSTASRILALIEDAAESKAKSENFITKFAKIYTPIVCVAALLVAVVPPLFVGEWISWIHRGLTFLVISCPCALVISIPLGFFGGIGACGSRGILVKGGNYLEALSKLDTIVFDKTGTLTKGVFKVVAIHPHDYSEERLLELATLAESFSDHPIARSLADEYAKRVDKARVSDAHEFSGKGITSVVDGLTVSCGNEKMMNMLGIQYHECEVPGTVVHVVINNIYAGHITISDQVKEDSKTALEKLRKLGLKKIVMLTGDKEKIAYAVAKELPEIDEYHAEMLPDDKVELTKRLEGQLKEKKSLAFVGDGINDAPVLTLADVGVAMGGMGSAAAVEAADVVLMNDKPTDVTTAIVIARKTMRIVHENIVFAIGTKLIVLVATVVGYDNMWLALFADVGVCLLAILNSLRALKVKAE